jgi:nucleotide-binding universal stress UspA family protein
MQMKTILVATDFSPASLNAANYAADMASSINANILLLHVYQVPVSYTEIPVAMNEQDLMENVEKVMNELKEKLILKSGGRLTVETEVWMGVFSQELKTVCERVKPYAVVMGSQGTTAAERLLFGSHTVYTMKHLMWPLITVPPEASFSSVKKIGLACDFDKVADTTPVDEIKMLVNDFNAELHVLNTGRKEVFNQDVVFGSGLLEEMLAPLKPNYHFIVNKNTDEVIMDFAERNDIDLLVVLPKRRGLLDSLVHKSHSKQFVLHSLVPVMALHQ